MKASLDIQYLEGSVRNFSKFHKLLFNIVSLYVIKLALESTVIKLALESFGFCLASSFVSINTHLLKIYHKLFASNFIV